MFPPCWTSGGLGKLTKSPGTLKVPLVGFHLHTTSNKNSNFYKQKPRFERGNQWKERWTNLPQVMNKTKHGG